MFDVLNKDAEALNQCRKKDKKEEEEDVDEEEEEDEESEVPQCDFNSILQQLKKKKINGNGFAAGEPSSGIRGSKQKIGDDPPHTAVPQCTVPLLFPLRRKFIPPPPPKFPTMHCFLPFLLTGN